MKKNNLDLNLFDHNNFRVLNKNNTNSYKIKNNLEQSLKNEKAEINHNNQIRDDYQYISKKGKNLIYGLILENLKPEFNELQEGLIKNKSKTIENNYNTNKDYDNMKKNPESKNEKKIQAYNLCEESDNETENDIELYAESEQILNFKNSMLDMNFTNVTNHHESFNNNKVFANEKENNINNKALNKNNSDFQRTNNQWEMKSNNQNEKNGFKKLINRKNSNTINNDDKDVISFENKKEKINVRQSAMANQYNIKIGDIDLNDHFYEKKINYLEEENKNLRERLRSVN